MTYRAGDGRWLYTGFSLFCPDAVVLGPGSATACCRIGRVTGEEDRDDDDDDDEDDADEAIMIRLTRELTSGLISSSSICILRRVVGLISGLGDLALLFFFDFVVVSVVAMGRPTAIGLSVSGW